MLYYSDNREKEGEEEEDEKYINKTFTVHSRREYNHNHNPHNTFNLNDHFRRAAFHHWKSDANYLKMKIKL